MIPALAAPSKMFQVGLRGNARRRRLGDDMKIASVLENSPGPAKILLATAPLLLFLPLYDRLYVAFLQNPQHLIANDYSLFFSNMLAGYYWYLNNGLFSLPWFSPAECGGVPFYPDPNVGTFSLPQLLVIWLSPLAAVQVTFWSFAVIGYAGAFLLLHRAFQASFPASLMGALIFMFNGFYGFRMLAGHLTFHAYMLAPILAFAVIPAVTGKPAALLHSLGRMALGGACVGYMFHAGMIHIIPPVMCDVLILILIHGALFGWSARPWWLLCGVVLIGAALSAGKFVASLAFVSHFPRDIYPLPGIPSLWATIAAAFETIFLGVPANVSQDIVNSPFTVDRHEWEYGISPAPLVPIAIWLVIQSQRMLARRRFPPISVAGCVVALGILVLFTLPILLNWYQPDWNAFLKRLPLLRSSSNLVRWFSLYILPIVLLSALAFDRLPLRKLHWATAGVLVILMLVWNWSADRSYYANNTYDPATIDQARAKATTAADIPAITEVVVLMTADRKQIAMPPNRNDLMTQGWSQLACYQPVFGYRLESFPVRPLRPGPVYGSGTINLKNPACYVFPEENQCAPGDHFSAGESAKVELFRNYKPYDFAEPLYAWAANWLSLAALIFVLAALAASGFSMGWSPAE
jgi:hypothetical protein